MAPEDNPADDVQPTKEEWEAYERRQSKQTHESIARECADAAIDVMNRNGPAYVQRALVPIISRAIAAMQAEIERLNSAYADAASSYAGICRTLEESGKRRQALLHHCEVVLDAYDSALRDGETKVWNGEAVDAMRATVKAEKGDSQNRCA